MQFLLGIEVERAAASPLLYSRPCLSARWSEFWDWPFRLKHLYENGSRSTFMFLTRRQTFLFGIFNMVFLKGSLITKIKNYIRVYLYKTTIFSLASKV
jgi:hypothetical protein